MLAWSFFLSIAQAVWKKVKDLKSGTKTSGIWVQFLILSTNSLVAVFVRHGLRLKRKVFIIVVNFLGH